MGNDRLWPHLVFPQARDDLQDWSSISRLAGSTHFKCVHDGFRVDVLQNDTFQDSRNRAQHGIIAGNQFFNFGAICCDVWYFWQVPHAWRPGTWRCLKNCGFDQGSRTKFLWTPRGSTDVSVDWRATWIRLSIFFWPFLCLLYNAVFFGSWSILPIFCDSTNWTHFGSFASKDWLRCDLKSLEVLPGEGPFCRAWEPKKTFFFGKHRAF